MSAGDCGQRRVIEVTADEDSTYLRIECSRLLEGNGRMWHILRAVVGRDMTVKMYAMNETFERGEAAQAKRKSRSEG